MPMRLRSFFSSGPAAAADPWDSSSKQSQEESSLKKLLIPQPGSPTSPAASGELISTAVPADVSGASSEVTSSSIGGSSAGSSSAGSASCSPTRATTLEAFQQHTGLTGRQPVTPVVDASFEELCHGGFFTRWSWSNWLVKLNRLTLIIIKQIYLFWLALPCSTPTNHVMLSFRTLVREAGEPNGNADFLAAKFRDELMPSRKELHRNKSPLVTLGRRIMELPYLGIPGIVRFIDVRTQWFDDSVAAAIRDGIKQVVIIAAGYDTRAYRLASPGVRFYEIDLPHASQHKQDLVRQLLPASKFPRPEYVAADLSRVKLADALATTSFNPQEPTLFTIEGLVYYLPPGAVHQLLSCIESISAPKSRIMMDFLHLSSLVGNTWHPGFETLWLAVLNKGERMYSGMDERPEAVEALMRMFGFHTHIVLTGRDLVQHYMPHVQYKATPKPTVSPFFGYLSAEKL